MFDSPSDRASECYRRAADCGERATRAQSPSLMAMYRKLEAQWLDLARSCELDESAMRLGQAARRVLGNRR